MATTSKPVADPRYKHTNTPTVTKAAQAHSDKNLARAEKIENARLNQRGFIDAVLDGIDSVKKLFAGKAAQQQQQAIKKKASEHQK